MSAYDTPTTKCPYCNNDCEADWVDVGIGMVQCGPYYCDNCGASEIGYYDDIGFDRNLFSKWHKENYRFEQDQNGMFKSIFIGNGKEKFIIPSSAKITQDEWDEGWYKPNSSMGSSVNTFSGKYVDHKTAKELYDLELLDKK